MKVIYEAIGEERYAGRSRSEVWEIRIQLPLGHELTIRESAGTLGESVLHISSSTGRLMLFR